MAKRESIESALAHLRVALHHLEEANAKDDSPYEPSGILRLIRKASLKIDQHAKAEFDTPRD